MATTSLRLPGFRRALAACRNPAKRRTLTTTPRANEEFTAAPPIRFTSEDNQFSSSRPHAEFLSSGPRRGNNNYKSNNNNDSSDINLARLRIVPASPSYFTATPNFTTDILTLSTLSRAHQSLPVLPPGEAPRVSWKTLEQYKTELAEPVRSKGYNMLLQLLKRLNYIHPSVLPEDVKEALERYKRAIQPSLNIPKPILVDQYGRTRAVGRRKTSSAVVWLVEGDGSVLINGQPLTTYFGRLHDRESAVWALKATQRLGKYNVWAIAHGGGTTGQADAIALGVGRALLAQEPDLKMAIRRCE